MQKYLLQIFLIIQQLPTTNATDHDYLSQTHQSTATDPSLLQSVPLMIL